MCVLQPNEIYHIYNYAKGDENLFSVDENYRSFLNRYAHFIHPIAHTYAYCLMPNHFHVLIKIKSEEELNITFPNIGNLEKLLSKQFSNLFSSYSQSYNRGHNRRGSLFIKNFKRKQIANEKYFTSLVHYIHCNPVHHGFCNSLEDWYWSSYHTYLNTKQTLLEKEKTLEWFGGKEEFVLVHNKSGENYYQMTTKDLY